MPGTTFNPASWVGYDEQSASNPSSALTDFTLIIDVANLSAAWKAAVQSDGGDIRLSKADNTELPFDLIAWSYNAGSPTGMIRVKWAGTLATSGTQRVRVWAGYADGTAVAYDANETYGSDNAYASHWLGYWPDGGGVDRTANGYDLTGTAITAGGVSGLLGAATEYNGSTSRADVSGLTLSAAPLTFACLGYRETSASTQTLMGAYDASASDQQVRMEWSSPNNALCPAIFDGSFRSPTGTSSTEDAWEFCAARYGSSTSRVAMINASFGPTDTGSKSPTGLDRITVGVSGDSTPSGFFDGLLQHTQAHAVGLSNGWLLQESSQLRDNATFWGSWSFTRSARAAAHYYHQHLAGAA